MRTESKAHNIHLNPLPAVPVAAPIAEVDQTPQPVEQPPENAAPPSDQNQVRNNSPSAAFSPDGQLFPTPSSTELPEEEVFQIASLRDKHNANLQNAKNRRIAEIPKLMEEFRNTNNPARQARILVNVGKTAGLISEPQAARLHNKIAPYIHKPDAFTKEVRTDFAKQLRQEMETHRNRLISQYQFSQKLNDALVVTDAGIVENIYQVVQLGDIGPMKEFSAVLKEQTLDMMDFAIESGMVEENNAAKAAALVYTAVDFFIPTNVIDVIGLGKGISKAIGKSKAATQAMSELLTKEGRYVVRRPGGGYDINYGKVNTLTESHKKTLVLMKMSEFKDVKTPGDLTRVKDELKKLLQVTTTRGKGEGVMDFARDTMAYTSATYQGINDIFRYDLYPIAGNNPDQLFEDVVNAFGSQP